MTKNTWIMLIIGLFIIGGVVVVSERDALVSKRTETSPITGTSTQTTVPILPYGNVTLKVGETATFKNSSIKLLRVVDESRCPQGVRCIWAGTVKVEVLSVSGMGTSTETIELGKSLTTEAEKISVLSVAPYPQKDTTITQKDYVVTFSVTVRSDTATGTTGACYVGGCSGEVCSDKPNVASNCIYKAEFACYKKTKCERQANGKCGWTSNAALTSCLANPPSDL